MGRLIVGFDAAWTANKVGAMVGIFEDQQGYHVLENPESLDYLAASNRILHWSHQYNPEFTTIMLDQPTIVINANGCRDVENIVSSPVSLRRGGVQPANTSKTAMFGRQAPVWQFLAQMGGAADPVNLQGNTRVIETYPVLALIGLGWILPDDQRPTGRLPKYNPERSTFSFNDWMYLCNNVVATLNGYELTPLANWLSTNAPLIMGLNSRDKKQLQDRLDALICLIVAIKFHETGQSLMVGNLQTGYMVVPYSAILHQELVRRCNATGRSSVNWVHKF